MRKLTTLLAAVAFMAVLTLVQRLFLDQSDTGREWALVAVWFGLHNWFLRIPKAEQIHAHQSEATAALETNATNAGDARVTEVATHLGLTTDTSSLEDSLRSVVAIDNEIVRPLEKQHLLSVVI